MYLCLNALKFTFKLSDTFFATSEKGRLAQNCVYIFAFYQKEFFLIITLFYHVHFLQVKLIILKQYSANRQKCICI